MKSIFQKKKIHCDGKSGAENPQFHSMFAIYFVLCYSVFFKKKTNKKDSASQLYSLMHYRNNK